MTITYSGHHSSTRVASQSPNCSNCWRVPVNDSGRLHQQVFSALVCSEFLHWHHHLNHLIRSSRPEMTVHNARAGLNLATHRGLGERILRPRSLKTSKI